jgi:tRNA-dihydrouridine synthase A
MSIQTHLISIAPMIDWTNTHFRMFMRMLAPNALLYTEMQTTGALCNNPKRALHYQTMEHPIAMQLGGSNPKDLSIASKLTYEAGFDEINLNLGCPSDRVKAGHFGACLMGHPKQVVDCLKAMKDAVPIPVTAKTRIGIDDQDSYAFFSDFVHQLVEAGIDKLIVHARKAWLHGLSPKQNRTVPPLHYEYVYAIKKELPNVSVVLNGNVVELPEIQTHLNHVDGVMLGRLACNNPYAIATHHHALYNEIPLPTRSQIANLYASYMEEEYVKGVSLSILIKPLLNLAHGLPNARLFKQGLLDFVQKKQFSLLSSALSVLTDPIID